MNDGTETSGHEDRSAETIEAMLEGKGLDLQSYEPIPGRRSLVARIEGRDPQAPLSPSWAIPTWCQRIASDWRHDPFGGELIDGEVWGRGAVDMLNLTSSMAVAVRHLAEEGSGPKVTSSSLRSQTRRRSATTVRAGWRRTPPTRGQTDYLITEAGGFPMAAPDGIRLPVIIGEKGAHWCKLTVQGRTRPRLASRCGPTTRSSGLPRWCDGSTHTAPKPTSMRLGAGSSPSSAFPDEMTTALLDPEKIEEFCDTFPAIGLARQAHACTHTTMAPTILHAGSKINVIPDQVELQIDIRTLPGVGTTRGSAMLEDVLGDLYAEVGVEFLCEDESTTSASRHPALVARSRRPRPCRTREAALFRSSLSEQPTLGSSAASEPWPTGSACSANT